MTSIIENTASVTHQILHNSSVFGLPKCGAGIPQKGSTPALNDWGGWVRSQSGDFCDCGQCCPLSYASPQLAAQTARCRHWNNNRQVFVNIFVECEISFGTDLFLYTSISNIVSTVGCCHKDLFLFSHQMA